jgi:7-cyano-7-deazaguanine reductase
VNDPVLGRPDAEPGPQIDTFPVDATSGRLDLVHFRSTELTAVCPVTNQPDFYSIDIEYTPVDRCIETKSLKLYLRTFDGIGIFAEHLAPRIAGHLAATVGTTVTVTLEQGVRGGITTSVAATAGVSPTSS